MEGNLNFNEAVDYGMTKLTAKEEGKQLGAGSVKTDSPVLPVDKLEKELGEMTANAKIQARAMLGSSQNMGEEVATMKE